jgi:hypothetical protein
MNIDSCPSTHWSSRRCTAARKASSIPWRNDAIFPSVDNVKGNEWKNNMTYKLDIFTNKYTYGQLYSFLDYGIIGSGGHETPIFNELHHKILGKRFEEIENKRIEK